MVTPKFRVCAFRPLMTLVIAACPLALMSCTLATVAKNPERFVQDGLPDNTVILRAEMGDVNDKKVVDGLPNRYIVPVTRKSYNSPIPCSAIKSVHWWASGTNKYEIEMLLVGHQYGGRYFPRPLAGSRWGAGVPALSAQSILKDEANKLADYCGVEFVTQQG